MKNIYLFITMLLFIGFSEAQAQSVDLQFVESASSDCENDLVCFNIQVRSTDGANYLGNSSIRFSYDENVVFFDGYSLTGIVTGTYTSLNYAPGPGCGAAVNYINQAFDGSQAGDFLITFVLNGNTDVLPTCEDLSSGDWIDVSEICFQVLDPTGNPNLAFTGVENGFPVNPTGTDETNFNDGTNDPTNKYNNGSFTNYSTNLDVSCACFPCICNPETSPGITGNAEICDAGTTGSNSTLLTADSAAPAGYTYQWQLNNIDIGGANGQTFTATQAGTYAVYFVSSENVACTTAATTVFEVVTAPAGCTDPSACNYDSGFFCDDSSCEFTSCSTGSIGSTVFEDLNGNGMVDTGEMGVQNATVTITGAGADGLFGTADDAVYNLMTNGTGGFVQGGLSLGVYNVVVTLPAPLVFSSGNGTYTTNVTNSGLFQVGTGGVIPAVTPTAGCALNIPLEAGWNIISSYCYPINDDMVVIFSGIQSDIIQVKNLTDVYTPALGFNTFSGWEIEEGYQVKNSVANTLTINGNQEVDPLVDVIPLNSGWNIIAYWLKNGVADPIDVFANIAADVIQVKNLDGAYTPAFGFNGIGDMEPTQGYQVKMSSTNNLMYDPSDAMLKPEAGEENERLEPVHFTRNIAAHPNNATFVLMDPEGRFNTEDEIAVFTQDGLLVGSCVYQDNGVAGMLIYGIDETLAGDNGIENGENFIVKSWDAVLQEESVLNIEFLQGNPSFEKDDLIVVALKSADTGIDEISQNIKVALQPNPASSEIYFTIEMNEASDVQLEILNLAGKQVDNIGEQILPKGASKIKYPIDHLSEGIYLFKMSNGQAVVTKRFVVAR